MGEGQRTRFGPRMVGCIINPYSENNAARKFEKGGGGGERKGAFVRKGGKRKQRGANGEISVL